MKTEDRDHNIENINAVIDALEGKTAVLWGGEQVLYNQCDWFTAANVGESFSEEDRKRQGSINGKSFSCGTTACIAGFVVLALDLPLMERMMQGLFDAYMLKTRARELLGLDHEEAHDLFSGSVLRYDERPTIVYFDNGEKYVAETPHAIQAVRVLKHLRDTGKVDWRVAGLVNAEELAPND